LRGPLNGRTRPAAALHLFVMRLKAAFVFLDIVGMQNFLAAVLAGE
jgi:hypothetical protein